MTTTTQTIETEMGVYSTCKYKSKVRDDTFKIVSLSPLNKKSMCEKIEMAFGNFEYIEEYTTDTNWWTSKVLNKWDMLFYKPIKVLEKIEITGLPGCGKIISKETFWLKKVLIKSPIKDSNFTHSVYVTFAISQGEKNGVYTLINKDNCNETRDDQFNATCYSWLINENLMKLSNPRLPKDADEREIEKVNYQHNDFKAFCSGTRIAQIWGKIIYIDI